VVEVVGWLVVEVSEGGVVLAPPEGSVVVGVVLVVVEVVVPVLDVPELESVPVELFVGPQVSVA